MQLNQSALGSSSPTVDEIPIMGNILGQHRGHIPGVGPTLPHSGSVASSSDNQSGNIFVGMHSDVRMLVDQVSFLRNVVARLAPDIQLPPMQPSISPSESSVGMNGDVRMLVDQISFLRDAVARLAPDVQLPPMRPSVTPSDSSTANDDGLNDGYDADLRD